MKVIRARAAPTERRSQRRRKKSASSRTRSKRCASNFPNWPASANSSSCDRSGADPDLVPFGFDCRLAEVEALEIVDAVFLQELRFFVGSDPFGNRFQIEVARQFDKR